MRCPRCRLDLAEIRGVGRRSYRCATCDGVALTMATLRKNVAGRRADDLWRRLPDGKPGDPCPGCSRALAEVEVAGDGRMLHLDACRTCLIVWFDAKELDAFVPPAPPLPTKARPNADLSPQAREALALAQIEAKALGDKAVRQAWTAFLILVIVSRLLRALR